MSAAKKITVRASSAPTPKTKPLPKASAIPVPFVYHPSDDRTDENLLILLHGLGEQSAPPTPVGGSTDIYSAGDTQVPFGKLGRQLHLPQTAALALRAPEQYVFPLCLGSFVKLKGKCYIQNPVLVRASLPMVYVLQSSKRAHRPPEPDPYTGADVQSY